MRSFLKMFLAAFTALVVFTLLGLLIFSIIIASVGSSSKESTGKNAVLVLDLSIPFPEIAVDNPFAGLGGESQYDIPGLYDVVRMINSAVGDSSVKGIYIKCGSNSNGFGASEDIRNALLKFKSNKKFIVAYGDVISQTGYHLASVADKIYCSPKGGVDWRGYSMNYFFIKGTLQKLEIEPQIFYAGKFKSATEPLRETQMTEANRLQSTVILNDLYRHFLHSVSKSRGIDSSLLRLWAVENSISTPEKALALKLVDGLKYDDEVRSEINQRMNVPVETKINFVPLGKYAKARSFRKSGSNKIMVIYAQGDIIDGKGERETIGSESYMNLIRRARTDKSIKAIVFRINSGGGSAMASENIWRELSLAKKEKPVVISFGDVSASGGYYLSCNADSIFAQPNTITGSIGVFSILPNMEKFFKNRMGVTFDAVKTAPDANALSVVRPLSESQKAWLQREVDSIYSTFTGRVAEGRRKPQSFIDSIGQGRIWSGTRALELGLVDRLGGLQEAIDCAARMAKLGDDYRLREFPEPENFLDQIFGKTSSSTKINTAIREEIGQESFRVYQQLKKVRQISLVPQARLPFEISFE